MKLISQHQQALHILQSGLVGTAFIYDDFHWKSVRVNGLFEKRGSRRFIPMFRKHKVNGIAELINGTVQVDPLAFNLDIGLIYTP